MLVQLYAKYDNCQTKILKNFLENFTRCMVVCYHTKVEAKDVAW